MKTLIFMCIALISLSSCSDSNKTEDISIFRKWNLIKFEGGFSPTEKFNEGIIIWEFQQNNTVKIVNDNSISSPPIKPNGEYNFSINGSKILIDNLEFDFILENSSLIISNNPSSDGFKATFSANQF